MADERFEKTLKQMEELADSLRKYKWTGKTDYIYMMDRAADSINSCLKLVRVYDKNIRSAITTMREMIDKANYAETKYFLAEQLLSEDEIRAVKTFADKISKRCDGK